MQLPEHPDLQGDRDVCGHHQEPDAGVDTHCKWLAPRLLRAILADVFGKQKPGQLYVACITRCDTRCMLFVHLYIKVLKNMWYKVHVSRIFDQKGYFLKI